MLQPRNFELETLHHMASACRITLKSDAGAGPTETIPPRIRHPAQLLYGFTSKEHYTLTLPS